MKVSQEPQNLTDILKDKTFKVPLYQREYSWELEQVSDLFYDIESSTGDDGHFLGSLLLYKDSNDERMEIVDGQQRITTLFLLLLAILDEIKDSDEPIAITRVNSLLFEVDPHDLSKDSTPSNPRLQTGKRDKKLFKAIIKGDDYLAYRDGRRKSHKNLTNALEFFKDKISEVNRERGISGVIDFTKNVIKSSFVVMTAEQQSDKLLLFKTVNARGIDLTQGDLIKNELCHFINEAELDMDEAIESWDEMRGRIEKNNGKLDTFLFHYINSIDYIQEERRQIDKRRGITKWDRNNYPPVPEKYIYDIFSQVIKREKPDNFLKNILKSSEDYLELINPTNNQVSLVSLKAMGVNKCFPLFLNIKRKITDKNFKLIVNSIDSLTFRHSILRNDPKELEKFYYILSEKIRTDADVIDAITKIKEHPNFKNEERFKSEFILASPKSSISRMILDRISKKLSESVDWSYKDTHIEHIMPQKPQGEWLELYNAEPEQYKDYLNRIGNLTILQDKKNIRARNKDFSEKKKYYAESRLKITNDLKNYNSWNYDSITERQEYLYELGKEIWQ